MCLACVLALIGACSGSEAGGEDQQRDDLSSEISNFLHLNKTCVQEQVDRIDARDLEDVRALVVGEPVNFSASAETSDAMAAIVNCPPSS